MKDSFTPALAAVLVHEGGFVDDPQDPGGATNKGITQGSYDDWRAAEGLPRRSVRAINDYEVGTIYRRRYWDACRCDLLPAGVDYAVFDFAVNSGANRAARYLQRALGLVDDGVIGPATLRAVASAAADRLIYDYCTARQAYLKQLPTSHRFGRGWTVRVAEVEARAKEMAA